MNDVKAIETEYNGYHFRSRLEARWAVFFDACGVEWEYEPEGFDLGNGVYYLPDFLLHEVRGTPEGKLWVEVKGVMTEDDRVKIETFAKDQSLLVVGNVPDANNFVGVQKSVWKANERESCFFSFQTVDGDDGLCVPAILKDGSFGITAIDLQEEIAEALTVKAYKDARCARFWEKKGEPPAPACSKTPKEIWDAALKILKRTPSIPMYAGEFAGCSADGTYKMRVKDEFLPLAFLFRQRDREEIIQQALREAGAADPKLCVFSKAEEQEEKEEKKAEKPSYKKTKGHGLWFHQKDGYFSSSVISQDSFKEFKNGARLVVVKNKFYNGGENDRPEYIFYLREV